VRAALVYDEGYRLAVVGKPGRLYVPIVTLNGAGLRVHKLPKAAERCFRDPPGKPHKSRLARVARKFLEFGRRVGMTAGARELLELAIREGA
jgi:hypothetical protein